MNKIKIISVLLASLLVISCTKESSSGGAGASGLLSSPLLSKIAPSSFTFMIWNGDSDAYKKFKKSPWGQSAKNGWLDWAEKMPESAKDESLKSLVLALKESGLLSTSENQPDIAKEFVGYAGFDSEKKVAQVGLLISAASGVNLKDKIGAIEKVLKSENIEAKHQSIANNDGLAIVLPAVVSAKSPIKGFYLAASADLLSIGSDLSIVEKSFAATPANGADKIVHTPQFEKLVAASPAGSDQFLFGYIDAQALVKLVPELAPDATEQAKAQLEQFPIDGAIMTKAMGETPADFIAVATSGKSDEQKRLLAALGGTSGADSIKNAPAAISLALSLDGGIIAGIKAAALSDVPEEAQAAMKDELGAIDGLKSLGLGVLNGSPTSPFPGVIISLQSSDPGALQNIIKKQLSGLAAGTGMPVADWQDKQVEGVKVSFVQSPMVGLGVYLSQTSDGLVLSSSEDTAREVILAGKDKKNALLATLPTDAAQMVNQSKMLLAAYGNFDKIASTIESVQGSLSAFTGGQSGLDSTTVEALRKIGSVLVAVNFDQGMFKIQSHYTKSGKQ